MSDMSFAQQSAVIICILLGASIFIWASSSGAGVKRMEGMKTADHKSSGPFIAAAAADYAAAVKAEVVQMQDELLVSKYRDDYENALMNLDDLLNLSLINESMSAVQAGALNMKVVRDLGDLQSAKAGVTAALDALGDL
jgi:hypothetical protein